MTFLLLAPDFSFCTAILRLSREKTRCICNQTFPSRHSFLCRIHRLSLLLVGLSAKRCPGQSGGSGAVRCGCPECRGPLRITHKQHGVALHRFTTYLLLAPPLACPTLDHIFQPCRTIRTLKATPEEREEKKGKVQDEAGEWGGGRCLSFACLHALFFFQNHNLKKTLFPFRSSCPTLSLARPVPRSWEWYSGPSHSWPRFCSCCRPALTRACRKG